MNKYRAAIIGCGFGGLSTAIRLQSSGFHTTIFEKRAKPGGRAYVYNQDGFIFDAGPTVLTAPECIEDIFRIARKNVEDYLKLLPVDPFYRLYWEDGYTFEYNNDDQKLFSQIAALNPSDVLGYRKFLKYSEAVFNEGYSKLVHVPFLTFWDMVKVSPQLMRLQAFSSVYSMVSRYIKDPKLREAFSFHSLLIGGNPFTASSIYTLIHCLERKWGVFFPKGGMGALVAALVKLYEDIGGQLRCNEEIERVLVEGNHVRGLKVRGLPVENFNLIVSNADVVHTYRDLIPTSPHSSKRFKRLANSRHSMSLFLIYFGTRKQYNNLAHHNIFFGPRYRELLSDIFERGILAGDFSLYLHAPCRTDPSLAPSGCDTFYVLSPVPHLGQGPIDWKILGPKYARKILESLQSKVMPDLLENIITQRIFTPLDFQQELNSHWGSAFSLEPTLSQSAYFRVHNKDSKISGLYFVGAGTHPGAGIPGVINSGRATYDVIMRDYALGGETKGLVYAVQTN